ncbi:hypothetical protein [Ulvibacterium marinum]|uniref:hypothetical protein n=1 Tax=Ulvibacterium marinum TaxID=2419782 RepID=UPI0011C36E06|nr:hypothetical protein [Ulvibacterium marinum]
MKSLFDLSGVKVLTSFEQKTIAGGVKCPASCVGRPQGSACYGNGHCGCPGECNAFETCIPY